MELITAENLKAAIAACDGVKSLVYMPAEARAVEVEGGGWVMHCGPYILRSARKREARVFRTIDALVNAAKECGIEEVQIGLTGDSVPV